MGIRSERRQAFLEKQKANQNWIPGGKLRTSPEIAWGKCKDCTNNLMTFNDGYGKEIYACKEKYRKPIQIVHEVPQNTICLEILQKCPCITVLLFAMDRAKMFKV